MKALHSQFTIMFPDRDTNHSICEHDYRTVYISQEVACFWVQENLPNFSFLKSAPNIDAHLSSMVTKYQDGFDNLGPNHQPECHSSFDVRTNDLGNLLDKQNMLQWILVP